MTIAIAAAPGICDSVQVTKRLAPLLLVPLLSACAATAIVDTAVTAVTLPVKVVAKTVDLATTSQSEADEKRGRELRELEERCRRGRPRATDDCSTVAPR